MKQYRLIPLCTGWNAYSLLHNLAELGTKGGGWPLTMTVVAALSLICGVIWMCLEDACE